MALIWKKSLLIPGGENINIKARAIIGFPIMTSFHLVKTELKVRMILQIGSKWLLCMKKISYRISSRRGFGLGGSNLRGFTFIELMVAVSILSLGLVSIYEAFFMSLDAVNYCEDYLNNLSLVDEKICLAQDLLYRQGPEAKIDTSGDFTRNHRNFRWALSYFPVGGIKNLYQVTSSIRWTNGKRKALLVRSAYAIYNEKE
jgi:prepilin-type N-terminal cleavage/methylation domain-containing protein